MLGWHVTPNLESFFEKHSVYGSERTVFYRFGHWLTGSASLPCGKNSIDGLSLDPTF